MCNNTNEANDQYEEYLKQKKEQFQKLLDEQLLSFCKSVDIDTEEKDADELVDVVYNNTYMIPRFANYLLMQLFEYRQALERQYLKIDFTNAQKMHEQFPATFHAPGQEELDNLKVGDLVNVCAFKERFWTIIQEIDGEVVVANIDNNLFTPLLKHGDTVTFNKHHIYQVYDKTA